MFINENQNNDMKIQYTTDSEETKDIFSVIDEILNIPLEEMNLSLRAYNCLTRAGLSQAKDLLLYTPDDLMKVRNLGRKWLYEVIEMQNKLFSFLGIAISEHRRKDEIHKNWEFVLLTIRNEGSRKKIKELLSDIYPGKIRKINAMLMVYDEGIIHELLELKNIHQKWVEKKTEIICSSYGITSDDAESALVEWIKNLRKNEYKEFTFSKRIGKFIWLKDREIRKVPLIPSVYFQMYEDALEEDFHAVLWKFNIEEFEDKLGMEFEKFQAYNMLKAFFIKGYYGILRYEFFDDEILVYLYKNLSRDYDFKKEGYSILKKEDLTDFEYVQACILNMAKQEDFSCMLHSLWENYEDCILRYAEKRDCFIQSIIAGIEEKINDVTNITYEKYPLDSYFQLDIIRPIKNFDYDKMRYSTNFGISNYELFSKLKIESFRELVDILQEKQDAFIQDEIGEEAYQKLNDWYKTLKSERGEVILLINGEKRRVNLERNILRSPEEIIYNVLADEGSFLFCDALFPATNQLCDLLLMMGYLYTTDVIKELASIREIIKNHFPFYENELNMLLNPLPVISLSSLDENNDVLQLIENYGNDIIPRDIFQHDNILLSCDSYMKTQYDER